MRNSAAGLMLGLAVACASGDQLVVLGGQTKEGSFQGFENGKFQFQTSTGKFMNEQHSKISKLILRDPTRTSYQTSDGKSEKDVVFKGYEKGKFMFVKDGKDVSVMAIKMKQLDPGFESEGGGDAGGKQYPIPKVDIANFGGDLNADQQAVIDRFTAAKKSFDDFVAASSAMVKEMDRLKGLKREEMLNELRRRNEAEQPLRKDLKDAHAALVVAFSEQPDEAPNHAAKEKPPSKAMSGLRSLSK